MEFFHQDEIKKLPRRVCSPQRNRQRRFRHCQQSQEQVYQRAAGGQEDQKVQTGARRPLEAAGRDGSHDYS